MGNSRGLLSASLVVPAAEKVGKRFAEMNGGTGGGKSKSILAFMSAANIYRLSTEYRIVLFYRTFPLQTFSS